MKDRTIRSIPVRRLLLGVMALFVLVAPGAARQISEPAAPAAARQIPEPAAPGGLVYRVQIHGVIELGLAPFVERALREATASGATALVLDIETPGGRVDAAQRIINALSDAEIPVYAFVNRRAYSAGAMIALAADQIFMVPGAVIGAATPVTGEGQKAPEKIVSAMRSEMRALAESRGLDPRVAEAMVDEDIEIDGIVEKGKLLTLTADEAQRVGFATEVADWNAMLGVLALVPDEVYEPRINWAEGLVRFLTHPVVAPMLLSLGFLGLIIEIKTPTFGLAGLAGGLSLAAFFGSHFLIGLAGWEEVLILGVGLALLGVEIFVVPGFGIFGLAGIVAVLTSIYLSLVGRFATGIDYSQAAGVLSASILIVLVSAWVMTRTLPRSARFLHSGIMLAEATDREHGYLSAAIREDLVGISGVALTDLRPAGTAQFGDERLDVTSDGSWIEAGSKVRVVRSEGYRHVVRAEG